jgi:hypothetical protein
MRAHLATACLAAAAVGALPTPAPAAGSPGDPWQGVSHLNGQLVKVGEMNEYVHAYRRTIISTNPIGLILGYYGLAVSRGLTANVALRGDLTFITADAQRGVQVDVGLPVYLRRTFQGPFFEPGFMVRHVDVGIRTEATVGPQVLVGWHWSWDSGLSVAGAVGVGRLLNESSERDNRFLNGYLRFGYAF